MAEQRRGFLETPSGHLSVLEILPQGTPRGSLLFVPPFGEEMNCCRGVAAALGRRLAARGFHWASADLRGTGESSGYLNAVRVEDWIADVVAVGGELERLPYPLTGVIGVRFGALLAAAALSRGLSADILVLLQPVRSGANQVRELIQQRALSDRLRGSLGSAGQLERALRQGATVELAGYAITPVLAGGMAALDLDPLLEDLRIPCHWLDIVSSDASRSLRSVAGEPGVFRVTVSGSPFWLRPEAPFPSEVMRATEDILSA